MPPKRSFALVMNQYFEWAIGLGSNHGLAWV